MNHGWKVSHGKFWSVLLFAALSLGFGQTDIALAQSDESKEKAKDASKEKPKKSANPYAVPDGDAEELFDFIAKVRAIQPEVKTQEEMILAHFKRLNAIAEACGKILAGKATDAQARRAVSTKLLVLDVFRRTVEFDKKDVRERIEKFLASLEDDPREGVQRAVQRNVERQALLKRIDKWSELDEEQRGQLLADIAGYLKRAKLLVRQDLQMARTLGRTLERFSPDTAVEIYAALAPLFAASGEADIAKYGAKFEGMVRRLKLPGNEMEIQGATLEGKLFDWASYRGKVVLVDFWATWCGPCVAELPNIKENYERYHDRGFDVVGISLDDDKKALTEFIEKRKIPWPILFSEKEDAQGWETPMAVYYGITGVPTAILVDREGKVVSLHARGERLDRQLAKLFDEPEKK